MPEREFDPQAGTVLTGAVKIARNPPNALAVHNDELAKGAGFQGGLIMNEYHFTQMTQMLMEYFGLGWLMHGEIELKYLAPLLDGDTFVPRVKILGEDPVGSGRLSLEVWCENGDGKKLAVGNASCLLPVEGIPRSHESIS